MEPTSALFELASVFLACRDQDTLLKTFAARVGPLLGAAAVFVWSPDPEDEELACRTRWTESGEDGTLLWSIFRTLGAPRR